MQRDVSINLFDQTPFEMGRMVRSLQDKLPDSFLMGATLRGCLSTLGEIPAQNSLAAFNEFMQGYSGTQGTKTIFLDFSKCTRKIEAIKTIRSVTGLGLKEAKDTVEGNRMDNNRYVGNIYRMPLELDTSRVNVEVFLREIRATGAEVVD